MACSEKYHTSKEMMCTDCISVTNVVFRVQKLRFIYKYLIVNLQNCISDYKVASQLAIQPFAACINAVFLRLVQKNEEKLKKSKDIFEFACFL